MKEILSGPERREESECNAATVIALNEKAILLPSDYYLLFKFAHKIFNMNEICPW